MFAVERAWFGTRFGQVAYITPHRLGSEVGTKIKIHRFTLDFNFCSHLGTQYIYIYIYLFPHSFSLPLYPPLSTLYTHSPIIKRWPNWIKQFDQNRLNQHWFRQDRPKPAVCHSSPILTNLPFHDFQTISTWNRGSNFGKIVKRRVCQNWGWVAHGCPKRAEPTLFCIPFT